MTNEEKLPLVIEGESKEIRMAPEPGMCWIRFKPTMGALPRDAPRGVKTAPAHATLEGKVILS